MDNLKQAKRNVLTHMLTMFAICGGSLTVSCVIIYFLFKYYEYTLKFAGVILAIWGIIYLIIGLKKVSKKFANYCKKEFKKAVENELKRLNDPNRQAKEDWDLQLEAYRKAEKKRLGRDLTSGEMYESYHKLGPRPG